MYKLKNQELPSGIGMDRKHIYAENLLQEKRHTGPRTWLDPSEPAK